MIIEVSEGKGMSMRKEVKDFIVTSVSTKAYNRWYMCDKGNQNWKRNVVENTYRFEVRMISYDHTVGKYLYVKPINSD